MVTMTGSKRTMAERNHQIKLIAVTLPPFALRPFAIVSFLLLFALPVDSLPLPIRAQVIPLTSLFAMLFLPFIIGRIHITPLFKMVILFSTFVLLHSVIALFIDYIILDRGEVRIFAWFRQVVALIAGLSVFFVLRRTLVHVSDRFVIYAVVAGALPALAVALLNILWGLGVSSLAGQIVTLIRTTLIPLGWTGPDRASGLSLEPSSFAVYLLVVIFPILVMLSNTGSWRIAVSIFAVVLASLGWTFSVTGFAILLMMLLIGIFLGPRRVMFTLVMVLVAIMLTLFIHLFPQNYAVYQIDSLLKGQYTVSFVDRFYSTIGPFLSVFSSYSIIGYGLGGTVSHITEILPENITAAIMSARWENMPMLGTLIGRIFVETGFIGLSLFSLVVLAGLWEIRAILQREQNCSKKFFIRSARLALLATLMAYFITLGSFAFPYLWFWLAVIDSRYIRLHRQ